MNIYCSRDPIVHFLPYPRVYSAAIIRGRLRSVCRFSPPYKEWLDDKKVNEAATVELRRCGGGKGVVELQNTDVDDRPKNATGRGGLSICLALMTTNCLLLF